MVNALWAGGAEAMQLMDQRVISTSAVRCVGNTLVLQGRVYSPPFRIAAIGDATRMQQALDASPGVRTYRQFVDVVGLGYQVEQQKEIDRAGVRGFAADDRSAGSPRRRDATVPTPSRPVTAARRRDPPPGRAAVGSRSRNRVVEERTRAARREGDGSASPSAASARS